MAIKVATSAINMNDIQVTDAINDTGLAAGFATRYVELVLNNTVQSVVEDFRESIEQDIQRIETELESRNQTYALNILTLLAKLKFAYQVAAKIGIDQQQDGDRLSRENVRLMVKMRRLY